MMNDGLPSPCISICTFKSHKERICIGCGRSQKQIRNWARYDVEMREKIMKFQIILESIMNRDMIQMVLLSLIHS